MQQYCTAQNLLIINCVQLTCIPDVKVTKYMTFQVRQND